jgi:hypothetical protein
MNIKKISLVVLIIFILFVLLGYVFIKRNIVYRKVLSSKALCEMEGGKWIECPSTCSGEGLCPAVCGTSFCQKNK